MKREQAHSHTEYSLRERRGSYRERERKMNEAEKNKTTNKKISPVLAVLEYVEKLRESHKSLMERIGDAREETDRNAKLMEEIRAKRLETERRVEKRYVEFAKLSRSLRSETRVLQSNKVVLQATETALKETESELNERKALQSEIRDIMTKLAKLKISNRERRESLMVGKRTRAQCQSELEELKSIRVKFQKSLREKQIEIEEAKEEYGYVMGCISVLDKTF